MRLDSLPMNIPDSLEEHMYIIKVKLMLSFTHTYGLYRRAEVIFNTRLRTYPERFIASFRDMCTRTCVRRTWAWMGTITRAQAGAYKPGSPSSELWMEAVLEGPAIRTSNQEKDENER